MKARLHRPVVVFCSITLLLTAFVCCSFAQTSSSNGVSSVSIVYPTNDAVFLPQPDIPLLARAGGTVFTNVEFFVGTTDLGQGHFVILDPPGIGGIVGGVYFLNWTNFGPGIYALTAVATDTNGVSVVSTPVYVTILSTNPPLVRIASPPDGAVFRAPVNIPIFAYATEFEGSVATVQFFADGSNLGFGIPVIMTPYVPPGGPVPALYIIEPYWELLWTNPPPATNVVLTAVATSKVGISATSAPVVISIVPPLPPPTNSPPSVGIVATDPIAIAGTNCWPWLGLTNPVPAWSNWFAASAVFQLETNCGPKDAIFTVFRVGETNDDLKVNYSFGGTAGNGVDYVTLNGVVVVPAGQQQAPITVIPLYSKLTHPISTLILTVAVSTNYVVGRPKSAAAIILDSQSPQPATGFLPGNLFQISSTGPEGAWFCVQYSTDLIHWTPLCTNQVISGVVDFVDPDALSQPNRFYEIVPESGASINQ